MCRPGGGPALQADVNVSGKSARVEAKQGPNLGLFKEKSVPEHVECCIDHRPHKVGGDQVEEPGSGGVVVSDHQEGSQWDG